MGGGDVGGSAHARGGGALPVGPRERGGAGTCGTAGLRDHASRPRPRPGFETAVWPASQD
jgi:hypothetical protein